MKYFSGMKRNYLHTYPLAWLTLKQYSERKKPDIMSTSCMIAFL